ncbi:unnamed protein product [Euphydryas editha]|uniref:Uncharacterized protein n=1 Tax=Euphydryas editha TaxID=104508 RepID=A0AAU9TVC2_EUPED|nr:unnamed protein product [Euphydryas editha]
MIMYPLFLKGYISIVVYIYSFEAGRLRSRWIRHEARLEDLREALELSLYKTWLLKSTRRWLQEGEMPYPGYCRSPGSGKCLPVLCNCAKLRELWKKMKNKVV